VTRAADIVEEILDHLRPLRGCRADIQSEVEKHIAMLIQTAPDVDRMQRFGTDMRQQAANAREALARLRHELAREPLRPFVVTITTLPPDVQERPNIVSELASGGAVVVDNQYFDRLDQALALKETIKTPDPRSNPMQWVCADTADSLIHRFSKKPATGTADGPLHAITSLLFEAITRKPTQDMKRAVDAMIRSWRGLDSGRGRPLGRRSIKRKRGPKRKD